MPAESAVKSRTLAAFPVKGTVEVTSATLDDTALAASASHVLSLSSIFTVYAERGRKREREADRGLGNLGDKLVILAAQSKDS